MPANDSFEGFYWPSKKKIEIDFDAGEIAAEVLSTFSGSLEVVFDPDLSGHYLHDDPKHDQFSGVFGFFIRSHDVEVGGQEVTFTDHLVGEHVTFDKVIRDGFNTVAEDWEDREMIDRIAEEMISVIRSASQEAKSRLKE